MKRGLWLLLAVFFTFGCVRTPSRARTPDFAYQPVRDIRPFEIAGLSVTMNGRAMNPAKISAIPAARFNGSQEEILARQNGFVLVPASGVNAQSGDLIVHENARPVVISRSSGRPEIVSGTLLVKVTDRSDVDRIASEYGFRLLAYHDAIAVAYFRVPDGFELQSGVDRLKADPRVLRVEIELLHGGVRSL